MAPPSLTSCVTTGRSLLSHPRNACFTGIRVRPQKLGGRVRPDGGFRTGAAGEEVLSPLEILRRENELLRKTIAAADSTIDELEDTLSSAGTEIPIEEYLATADEYDFDPAGSDDDPALAVWTPVHRLPPGERFVEHYGIIPPIPSGDGTECLKWDQTLWSHGEHFKYRWRVYCDVRNAIDANEGGLEKFSRGYEYYGLNRGEHEGKPGIWYREWAPAAKAVALVGEYNNWVPLPEHWAFRNAFGVWELFLPDDEFGRSAIPHRSKVKARVENCHGEWTERIPAWIKWATQEWNEIQFNGVYWRPPLEGEPGEVPVPGTPVDQEWRYTFKYPRPQRPRALRIYECHVGMSSQEPKVNSYLEFREDMLPRIRKLGYNAIQIMAIQEHAYYGSFGYHVTNFFGVSSRSGTPEELKALIDEAHRMGMYVLMDIVHSHASSNANDGINLFDGSDAGYFHAGARGYHWMWDSRCFNYGNWETLRFLMSNARWWVDEYKFDGYRFDGVTSMMYHHHGLSMAFSGSYDEYFGMSTDVEAVVYLMLANTLLHELFPNCITIGEDVSGMPTFCRPWYEGGIGFDYRLNMAIADKWIDTMKLPDEAWGMGDIVHTMTNRRYAEACVGYAESHDQALVGDKTIAFWLMDAAMYDCMAAPGHGPQSPVVDRGIALHKMIRLITLCLGGESYLNFMGNEFGHPEWIDFPRDDSYDPSTGAFVPGNGGSLEKCRRRWDLSEAEILRYRTMNSFDRAMNHLDKAFGFLNAPHTWVSRKDEGDKMVVVERGDLVFVFNFHPFTSFTNYRVGCLLEGPYKVVLSSDEEVFGGYRNVSKDNDTVFTTIQGDYDRRPCSFLVYAPSRTVVVYAPAEYCDAHADSKPIGIPGLGVKGLGPYFQT